MPERYAPYPTCHRRFQSCKEVEVMTTILERLAKDPHEQGDIDLPEQLIGNKAYDSDPLDTELAKQGLSLSHRTDATVKRLKLKTDASYVGTNVEDQTFL